MKPVLSYYGGKQRLASRIVPLLYPHTVYVEPFAGGASILFAKGLPETSNSHDYREVLNDHDERLITFYRALQDSPGELVHRICSTPYSEAEFNRAKEITRSGCDSQVMRAWAYYIESQMGFANRLNTSWRRSVATCNFGATWASKLSNLAAYIDRMSEVYLSCQDAIKCIEQWDSPQTCFYVDPPYPGADQGHYAGYTSEDFARLVAALDNAKGSFLLSNYDQPCVPESWQRLEFDAYASSGSRGDTNHDLRRKEVIWRRPARDSCKKELEQKLWAPSAQVKQLTWADVI